MKKLFLATIVVFALVACVDTNYYSVSITNITTSSKTVTYTFNNESDTLTASETKNYVVQSWARTQPPKDITDENGIASLTTEQVGDNYNIKDASSLNLSVVNTLPVNVTIKADNFIENGISPSLTINANTESTGGVKIYTRTPNFTSTTNYPIIINMKIVGNTMYVIIR